jgi:hypothetical protein
MIINISITELIIDYFNTDKRISSYSEIGRDIEKIRICKYSNLIEIFIGSDNYTNLFALNVDMDVVDKDEIELLQLDKDDNLSDVYNFQNIPIRRNPHLYVSLRPVNTSPVVKSTKIRQEFILQVYYNNRSVKSQSHKVITKYATKIDLNRFTNKKNPVKFKDVLYKYNQNINSLTKQNIIILSNGDMFYFKP